MLFDRVVRQVNGKAMGKGVRLRDENGGSWEIKQVIYLDDTVFLSETREHLQRIGVSLRGRVTV